MTDPIPTLLSRLKALDEKATPEPWNTEHYGTFVSGPVISDDWDWIVVSGDSLNDEDDFGERLIPNNEFIAALRNALPQLLAHIEAQAGEIERLDGIIKKLDTDAIRLHEELHGRAATPSSPAVRCSDGKHTCECGFHIDHCVAPPTRQPLREMQPEVNDYCCRVCSPKWWGMFTCKKCGNKRCPHATNHLLDCTDSNEYGQSGSVYCDSPRGGEGESGGHKERP